MPLMSNIYLLPDLEMAEREGFEPPEQLPVHRISSAARSTTPASFLVHCSNVEYLIQCKIIDYCWFSQECVAIFVSLFFIAFV